MATPRLSESLDMHEHGEPGVVSALGRAIESAQGLVANRIDLAKLDVLDTMSDMIRAGAMVVCGSLMMAIGWACLSVAAVLVLERWTLDLPLSGALVGGVNMIAGAVVVWAASQKSMAPSTHAGRTTNGGA